MKRGEIWTAAGGVYMTKPRPVLMLQANAFPRAESVTICPISSDTRSAEAPLLRVALAADAKSGLAQPSWAMVDKITTVRAKSLTTRVGQVTGKELKTISANAAVFLGLAG